MHVANAAPIPVPVQIRIPRLYSLDVFETPASYCSISSDQSEDQFVTDLQLSRPDVRRRIIDKALGEVTYRSDESYSERLTVHVLP